VLVFNYIVYPKRGISQTDSDAINANLTKLARGTKVTKSESTGIGVNFWAVRLSEEEAKGLKSNPAVS
jgi:hypothetical protein